ncbi:MAG: hypothetical protein KDC46_09895 [Thermoleophilia bacterium]|nr:hypothetical protein [Thermoleophilia bacterium]
MTTYLDLTWPPIWDEPRHGLLSPVHVDALPEGEGVSFVTAIPGWRVSGEARRYDADLVIRRLAIDPLVQRLRFRDDDGDRDEEHELAPDGGLRTQALRQVPLARILSEIRVAATRMREPGEAGWQPGTWDTVADNEATSAIVARSTSAAAQIQDAVPSMRAPGRPRLSDSFIAGVALRIVGLNENGSRSPVTDLAHELSVERGESVPVSRVRRWVKQARADGWLLGMAEGAQHAYASEKLIAWAKEQA